MGTEVAYVNLQSTRVHIIDPNGVNVAIFPWSDDPKGKGVYEVSGKFYEKYLAPKGPLSPKPETHKPFRNLSLPDLDPRMQSKAGTLLPVELARAMAASNIELADGNPAKLNPDAAPKGEQPPKAGQDDGKDGLAPTSPKTLESVAGPLSEALRANGIESLSDLAESKFEFLIAIPGITETTAKFLMHNATIATPPKSDKLSKQGLKGKVKVKDPNPTRD